MHEPRVQLRRWLAGGYADLTFYLVVLCGGAALLASFAGWTRLSPDGMATLFTGLLAGIIVWWQIQLLVRQLEYTAVQDLDKEWNSAGMLERRKGAWVIGKDCPNPEKIEDVLEFLEKVSTLERKKYISRDLIWDTFGWYLGRYYYYCKSEIAELRKKWTKGNDPTLYQDLEHFYIRLIDSEATQRKLKPEDVEKEYDETMGKFIRSERE
jgi:hypothetical protein